MSSRVTNEMIEAFRVDAGWSKARQKRLRDAIEFTVNEKYELGQEHWDKFFKIAESSNVPEKLGGKFADEKIISSNFRRSNIGRAGIKKHIEYLLAYSEAVSMVKRYIGSVNYAAEYKAIIDQLAQLIEKDNKAGYVGIPIEKVLAPLRRLDADRRNILRDHMRLAIFVIGEAVQEEKKLSSEDAVYVRDWVEKFFGDEKNRALVISLAK